MSKFAEVLKRLMNEQKVTPKALSKHTGIPISTISEWTAGRQPRLNQALVKLARHFGVSLEYLVTGHDIESEVVQEVVKAVTTDFTVIHRGIYRVTIEKQKPNKGEQR